MKKIVIVIFGFILLTNSLFSQRFDKKTDSLKFKKINLLKIDIENNKQFLKILDSNKEAKDEYLLGLNQLKKGRKDLMKSLGIGSIALIAASSTNLENEIINNSSIGAVALSLYFDISSIIHNFKAMRHLQKAYKIAGIKPSYHNNKRIKNEIEPF